MSTTPRPDGDYLEQVRRDTRRHNAAQRAADRLEYGRPIKPAALCRVMHAWVAMSLAAADDERIRAKVERSLADTRPNVPHGEVMARVAARLAVGSAA